MTEGRKPLGVGLRCVQAYYLLVLAVGFGYAALLNPKGDLSHVYDFSMLRAIVQMATSAQAVWMLQRRMLSARRFCMVTTAICMVFSIIDIFFLRASAPVFAAMGPYASTALVLVEFILPVAVIAYLAFARRPLEVLCIEYKHEGPREGNSWDVKRFRFRIRTWEFWRDLIIYFIVFSFLGHWAEMLFCRLIVAGVFMGGYDPTNAMLWDQWLFPFSAEGTALAMVALFLFPLKHLIQYRMGGRVLPALAISFLVNAFVCTSIDFLTGITCNLNYDLWDYRDMPFNFMGQICLQNSLVYSIAATLIVWVIYPLMDRGLRMMKESWVDCLFFGLVGFYAFEAALHFIVI